MKNNASIPTRFNRRDFVKIGAAVTAGLVIGCRLENRSGREGTDASEAAFAPNAFIRIGPDNTVTVVAKHTDR